MLTRRDGEMPLAISGRIDPPRLATAALRISQRDINGVVRRVGLERAMAMAPDAQAGWPSQFESRLHIDLADVGQIDATHWHPACHRVATKNTQ